ncbi:MAG: NAD-dependent epimerase/dehydratase family protein [Armatimonadetes bacterium]|nr:NAD-dependent epimerase/dehydratase family protein [Armatimonadota bacterium]
MELAGKTFLVTGGAGFIGSHLVDALLAQGAQVKVIDNLSTGHLHNLQPVMDRIEFAQASVLDFDTLLGLAKGCAGIFHLAAVVSVPLTVKEPLQSHEVNSRGVVNVLEAARLNGARVVFSSSAAVYGENEVLPHEEEKPLHPLSPYGVQKLYGEQCLFAYQRLYGVGGFALRYFNVYGPRQDPGSPYSGVISLFINWALRGDPMKILGDGEQTRDFIYVADVVKANLLAMETEGGDGVPINVATGKTMSLKQLAEAVMAASGTKSEVQHGPAREGDIRHSSALVERAKELIAFQAQTPFEEGIARTVEFFRA